ncbi:MAG TPA: alternative ribosome rescue aminoacyl-tRNA hydrolase ArfB [Acidimicrobiia bacterium]|nr:alternative ribosome rescue aminoacyl-tRNA hydrolase ArfB [Acidimicrobiia bacterium]
MTGAPIRIGGRFVISAEELRWRFDTSGGPGGQHANKASTRVELSWDLAASTAIPDGLRRHMLERLGPRAPQGVVTVIAGDTRSQWRNRALARRRMEEILTNAIRVDPDRIPTRVPSSVRRRRLERKRRRAETKQMRREPEQEE